MRPPTAFSGGGVTKVVGAMNFGAHFVAQSGAVVLGGAAASYTFGDNVTVGSGAVVSGSSIGSNTIIGARSVVLNSTVAANQTIAPGTVMIDNVIVGHVAW